VNSAPAKAELNDTAKTRSEKNVAMSKDKSNIRSLLKKNAGPSDAAESAKSPAKKNPPKAPSPPKKAGGKKATAAASPATKKRKADDDAEEVEVRSARTFPVFFSSSPLF
jgi:hypothetical protein